MMGSRSSSWALLVRFAVVRVEGERGGQLILSPPSPPRAPTELFYDRGNHYEFLSLVQELATPGEMKSAQAFDFEFKNVEKQYESYHGINVKLRCVLRVRRSRGGRSCVCSRNCLTGTLCA